MLTKEKTTIIKDKNKQGCKALLNMAMRAKKENIKGSKDLSENHDQYIYKI